MRFRGAVCTLRDVEEGAVAGVLATRGMGFGFGFRLGVVKEEDDLAVVESCTAKMRLRSS